jgi:hypothetical protein
MGVGPLFADRVKDTTTTTGTGAVTLSGTAPSGFQSFNAGIGDGNSCYYTIEDQSGFDWEIGIGTYTNSSVSLSRDTVLSSSNSGSLVSFPAGTKNVFVPLPKAGIYKFRKNLLVNSGMWYFQRQTPGTLTTLANDKYGPDRWRMSSGAASFQSARNDTNGALETGLSARFYANLKQITNSAKALACQPVEANQTFDLASRPVVFQCKMRGLTAKTMRLGILQLTSSGTIDTIPSAIVPTTWGANSTDPTWGANLQLIAPNLAFSLSGATVSIVNSAINCSALTTWQTFGGLFYIPSNALNLIPIIWTDSALPINDYFCWSEAGLYSSETLCDWNPMLVADEFARCQRYYEKSYDPDILPGTSAAEGYGLETRGANNTNTMFTYQYYAVPKRVAPTQTMYDGAGNSGKVSICDQAATVTDNQAFSNLTAGTTRFKFSIAGLTCTGAKWHFTADAEM